MFTMMLYILFAPFHFFFFIILSGVSPGRRTRASIKSGPNSIFAAAVNVTASDLVVGKDMSDFSEGDTVFHSWTAGACTQVKRTTLISPPPLSFCYQ